MTADPIRHSKSGPEPSGVGRVETEPSQYGVDVLVPGAEININGVTIQFGHDSHLTIIDSNSLSSSTQVISIPRTADSSPTAITVSNGITISPIRGERAIQIKSKPTASSADTINNFINSELGGMNSGKAVHEYATSSADHSDEFGFNTNVDTKTRSEQTDGLTSEVFSSDQYKKGKKNAAKINSAKLCRVLLMAIGLMYLV
jgi:hypothetical protein